LTQKNTVLGCYGIKKNRLPETMTVGELGAPELVLINIENITDQPDGGNINKSAPKKFFMTPSTAKQYKEFEASCIRFKNFSKTKQERVIGIDGDGIQFKKKSNARKSIRPMSELVLCQLVPTKQYHFILRFEGGKDMEFESPDADEIVAKITFLMDNA